MRLMLILQCILGLQSKSIDFTNAFAQAYIPSGSQSSMNFPGISRVMKDNMMLFSNQRKAYVVKLKLHTYP